MVVFNNVRQHKSINKAITEREQRKESSETHRKVWLSKYLVRSTFSWGWCTITWFLFGTVTTSISFRFFSKTVKSRLMMQPRWNDFKYRCEHVRRLQNNKIVASVLSRSPSVRETTSPTAKGNHKQYMKFSCSLLTALTAHITQERTTVECFEEATCFPLPFFLFTTRSRHYDTPHPRK